MAAANPNPNPNPSPNPNPNPNPNQVERTRGWLRQKVLGSEGAHVRHYLFYSLWIVVLLYCTYQVVLDFLVYSTSFVNTKVLGAKIEWVRELLRFGTGRATLRAFDEPASCLEDDKDGVTVGI